jgi:parallel beta-helix repeat protein
MDYFRSYSLSADDAVVAAWDSQVASAAEIAPLSRLLAERGAEVFPEFARRYAEVAALPRSARRALQRKLAASRDLANIPAEWRRKLAYSIAGVALLLALAQSAAHAGDIFVNTKIADVDEINPTCSLGDAIRSADSGGDYGGCTGATVSPNTIHLPSGSQSLRHSFSIEYGSYTGLPKIQSDITIVGNKTKIARKSKTFFRLFAVASGGKLTLDGVTLSGGVASSDGVTSGDADGGAVFVYLNASLTLQNSTISGNLAGAGGAILNDGVTVINASVISKNTADRGGAVFNNANNVVINNGSVLTGNKAHYGGAIYGDFGSTTVIDNSTLSKNSAARGGAVHNPLGIVRFFNNSIVTGNKASSDGGGISNSGGLLQVDESTISKNSAGDRGGGVFGPGYTFILTNSTVTGNKAGTSGGGIYLTGTAKFTSSNNYVAKNKAPTGPDYAP